MPEGPEIRRAADNVAAAIKDRKAKEIFFENNCHQTTMIREGVYEEFKKYGGNYELQQKWRKEFISYWVGELSTEDLTPVDRLHFAWGEEALPELIEMSQKGDGYSRLWYANAIWDLTKSETVSEDTRKKGEETAIRIWEDLVNNPIENLSEGHKKTTTPALFALGASTPEEYVVNYAKSQLQKNNVASD